MSNRLSLIGAAAVLLALNGCDTAKQDAWNRPLTWQSTGANEANLRAMIANPNDLVVGQGARGSNAILANAAVTRVFTDKVKQLPRTTTGSSTGGGGGETAAGGGGSTTGLGGSGGAAQ